MYDISMERIQKLRESLFCRINSALLKFLLRLLFMDLKIIIDPNDAFRVSNVVPCLTNLPQDDLPLFRIVT